MEGLSWQSGRFKYQRPTVWMEHPSIANCIEESKIRRKTCRLWPPKWVLKVADDRIWSRVFSCRKQELWSIFQQTFWHSRICLCYAMLLVSVVSIKPTTVCSFLIKNLFPRQIEKVFMGRHARYHFNQAASLIE